MVVLEDIATAGMESLATGGVESIIPVILMMVFFMIIITALILIAVYVYSAWALMTIAHKTKTKYAWLAWIPIANFYLMTQIGKVPWWTILIPIILLIPSVGLLFPIGFIVVYAYWWWNIAEKRKMPGWLGILMAVPLANLVVMGIIAWKK